MAKGRTREMMEHLRCDHCGEFNPSLADRIAKLATDQYYAYLKDKAKEEWDHEIVELGGELDGKAAMLALLEDEVLEMLEFYKDHPERLGPKH